MKRGFLCGHPDHEGSEFRNMDGLDEKLVNNFGEIFFSKYPRQLTVFR